MNRFPELDPVTVNGFLTLDLMDVLTKLEYNHNALKLFTSFNPKRFIQSRIGGLKYLHYQIHVLIDEPDEIDTETLDDMYGDFHTIACDMYHSFYNHILINKDTYRDMFDEQTLKDDLDFCKYCSQELKV